MLRKTPSQFLCGLFCSTVWRKHYSSSPKMKESECRYWLFKYINYFTSSASGLYLSQDVMLHPINESWVRAHQALYILHITHTVHIILLPITIFCVNNHTITWKSPLSWEKLLQWIISIIGYSCCLILYSYSTYTAQMWTNTHLSNNIVPSSLPFLYHLQPFHLEFLLLFFTSNILQILSQSNLGRNALLFLHLRERCLHIRKIIFIISVDSQER